MDERPLVVHVVYRFDVGGLENGVVNLINHLPEHTCRHAVVALTEVSDFAQRVRRKDVEFVALHKPPGHGLWLYPRLYRLFRRMRPAVVHTRNLAALEAVVPAKLAGVPWCIHGEHGRDVRDLDGRNARYRWMRCVYRPFVNHYVALSRDLHTYLTEGVGVPEAQVTRLCNGVDSRRFRPAQDAAEPIPGCPFSPSTHWLLGWVGRMQAVKAPELLVEAFIQLLQKEPALRDRVRLVMAGEGPLRARCQERLVEVGMADLAWLPGERSDVDAVMRGLHCFALPSLAEGISNTILEAMATGLPVVASRVGGNPELIRPGVTGELVPPADTAALADSLGRLASDSQRAQDMGRAGRTEVERRFSLDAMVAGYQALYEAAFPVRQPVGAKA